MYDFSQEAANNVIGSLFLSNIAFDEIIDILCVEDFESAFHQKIFMAVKNFVELGKSYDIFLIADYLKLDLDEQTRLISIGKSTPTAANVKHYAGLVKDAANNRKLFTVCQILLSKIKSREKNILDVAQSLILDIDCSGKFYTEHISYNTGKLLYELQEIKNNPDKTAAISTGFVDIDKIIGGLKRENLIVVGARPGMGKTQLALNIAKNVAHKNNKTVLFFTLEMSMDSLRLRLTSNLTKISFQKIERWELTEEQEVKVADAFSKFHDYKIFLNNHREITIAELKAECRRIKRLHGLDLIIVDYLSLMGGKGENETLRLGSISRGLKIAAQEFKVPVIALVQLNREVEKRDCKIPVMSDIKQSGDIEQDADSILMIYRDEKYHSDTPAKNIVEINIVKNRHGDNGKAFLTFLGEYSKFESYYGSTPVYKKDFQISKKSSYVFKPDFID